MTPEKAEKPPSQPLLASRLNIFGLASALFLLLVFISFALSFRHYQDEKRQMLLKDRQSAQLLSLIAETYIHDIRTTIEAYASRPLLTQAVREKDASEARRHLLMLTRMNPYIDSVVIADKKGTVWAALPDRPDILGKNFSFRDWYRGVSREWKPYIAEAIIRSTGEKDTAIHIAVPIFNDKKEVLGILLSPLRAVEMGKVLRRAPMEEGLFIAVTDRKGTLLYSSRFAHEKKLVRYPFFDAVKTKPLTTVTVRDPAAQEEERHISYAPVAEAGLHVFVGRDQSSVRSKFWGHLAQISSISILLFVLFVLLLLYARKNVIAQSALESLKAEKEISAGRSRFSELFNQLKSGVAIYQAIDGGRDFEILELNDAARRITKVGPNAEGGSVLAVYPGLANHTILATFQNVWRTGNPEEHPTFLYQDDRQTFWADNYVFKLPSGEIVSVFDDVTARKLAADKISRQTRLLSAINRLFAETLKSQDTEAVARTCLAAALSITDSEFGFIGEVGPDGLFSTYTVSETGWDACSMPQKEATASLQNMIIRGIWGQVILREQPLIVDDPGAFPDRVGVPEGHPPLTSFLGVPLKDGRKTIGMIALANRTGGYTGEQREDLEELAVSLVEALRRNQAEEKVKNMYQELEKRVIERTGELVAKTEELERINRVFVDRELKMRELKARIAELEKKAMSDER